MKENQYAFAVSSVRVNETRLLTGADVEQLLAAPTAGDVLRILRDRGWGNAETGQDSNGLLRAEAEKTWRFLEEIAPAIELFHSLILKNDYHNLKAALKCSLSGTSPNEYFTVPTVYDAEQIGDAIAQRSFEALPAVMQDAAREAYDVLVRTQDGQLADTILDAAALHAMRAVGRKSGNAFIDGLTELICATTNIKTAVRAAKTAKNTDFLERALSECDTLDKAALVNAAIRGTEPLYAYLAATPYEEAVAKLQSSPSAFEKWCDDLIMERLEAAKYQFFGPEPLAAFYLARDAEIKTVRIILSAKQNKVAPEIIRERLRKLYV